MVRCSLPWERLFAGFSALEETALEFLPQRRHIIVPDKVLYTRWNDFLTNYRKAKLIDAVKMRGINLETRLFTFKINSQQRPKILSFALSTLTSCECALRMRVYIY